MSLSLFTISRVAQIVDAHTIGSRDIAIANVIIDSRLAQPRSLFIALPGRHVDGHQFIAQALESGECAAIISARHAAKHSATINEIIDRFGGAVCVVRDPARALRQLAREHLKQYEGATRVAITGSNGKTVVKEMARSIIGNRGPAAVSRGNYNSDIGLPLEAFRVGGEHRYAIFEMGMNREGEIAELTMVARPHFAVITNIGTAHIGRLGSRDAIAKEKGKIFDSEALVCGFIHEENPYRKEWEHAFGAPIRCFGKRSTPGYRGCQSIGLRGSIIHWRDRKITLPLPGLMQVDNSLAAISLALALDCSEEDIVSGLEAVSAIPRRAEIASGAITAIVDDYNASPESTRAALDLLSETRHRGRKIAVLGPMEELGDFAEQYHREILDYAMRSGLNAVFIVGERYRKAYDDIRSVENSLIRWHDSRISLEDDLAHFVRKDDLVLFKASNSHNFKTLADFVLNNTA